MQKLKKKVSDLTSKMEMRLTKSKDEVKRLSSNYELLRSRLNEIEFSDPHTGIPNDKLFQSQFSQFRTRAIELQKASSMGATWVASLDLVDFGELNHQFLPSGADKALFIFAHRVHQTMRRNEHFYRRYRSGDEFLIMFETKEDIDALFFMKRLIDELENVYSPEIGEVLFNHAQHLFEHGQINQLPSEKPSIRFWAGLCKISAEDKWDTIVDKADAHMERARSNEFGVSVVWQDLAIEWNKVRGLLLQSEKLRNLSFKEFFSKLDDPQLARFGAEMAASISRIKEWERMLKNFSS